LILDTGSLCCQEQKHVSDFSSMAIQGRKCSTTVHAHRLFAFLFSAFAQKSTNSSWVVRIGNATVNRKKA